MLGWRCLLQGYHLVELGLPNRLWNLFRTMSHQHPFHLCVESFHQGCAGGGGVRLIPKNGNQPKEIARLDNVTVKVIYIYIIYIYSWWCPIGKDPRGCNFQYDNMDNLISAYWQLLKKAFVRETHFEKNFPLRIAQLCWIFQVSSQAGCPLDCRFCDSGKAGLIEQVRAV